MITQVNDGDMLKVDVKLYKKYHPDAKPISYFKTLSKSSRLILFDDKTFMHIETCYGKWKFFDSAIKNNPYNEFDINILSRDIDKDGRVITIYNIKD